MQQFAIIEPSVDACASIERVVTRTATQFVVASANKNNVGTRAAFDDVVARTCPDRVVPRAAANNGIDRYSRLKTNVVVTAQGRNVDHAGWQLKRSVIKVIDQDAEFASDLPDFDEVISYCSNDDDVCALCRNVT